MLDRDNLIAGGRYAALGVEFGGTIVGCLLAGYYLDEYVGTAPLFTLLFILGGLAGALRLLLWSLKKHNR